MVAGAVPPLKLRPRAEAPPGAARYHPIPSAHFTSQTPVSTLGSWLDRTARGSSFFQCRRGYSPFRWRPLVPMVGPEGKGPGSSRRPPPRPGPRQDAGEDEGTMLLLTRKLGENIRIGDDVKITIVEVKGNHVKLGIDAPPSVKVHREEIYERIQQENRRAQALRESGGTPNGETGTARPSGGQGNSPSRPDNGRESKP